MTRLSRASLVGATIATLSVFGLVIPLLANQGPATQRLTEDTVVGTTYGEVTLPVGWDLDIAAAASPDAGSRRRARGCRTTPARRPTGDRQAPSNCADAAAPRERR